MTVPLEGHEAFHTRDLDEARVEVSRAFCDHKLELLHGTALDARQRSVQLRTVSLHYLDYGGEVRISPGPLESFYLVQIPLSGAAGAVSGTQVVAPSSNVATVLSPVEPVAMHWAEQTPHLIVRLNRQALEERATQLLGRTVRKPVCFDLGMDIRAPQAQSFLRLVDLLKVELEHSDGLVNHPLAVAQLEQFLMTSLLAAQPSNYSDQLTGGDDRAAAPRSIRRAIEIIEEHAREPLTVEDIAEAVGVSVRALQAGFHRHVKCSPMSYLREIRLDRVREALTAADPAAGITVTDVAYQWGFLHLARFAQAYKQKFGELPSATLRH